MLLGPTPCTPSPTESRPHEQLPGLVGHAGFNPFLNFDHSVLQTYLNSFLTHVNHLLYFFREDDAENAFLKASEASTEISESLTELCLTLAIGAKVHQPQDLIVSSICYTCGSIQLQRLEPLDSIRRIRAMTLLSYYHMDEDIGTSCHYLRS